MTDSTLILLCDHSGEGLSETLAPLELEGYQLLRCGSLRQSLACLAQSEPAVIILDPLSPGGTVELEALGHSDNKGPAPLLIVADASNPLPTVRAAEGAVSRTFDLIHRAAPFEEYLMRVRQLSEVTRLRHRAAHDDRTDLLRPQLFEERLRAHFAAAKRHKFELSLLLADIDKFKRINDENDHVVGDYVIEQIGHAIRRTLRKEDLAGRLGGDEFGILLPYTGKLETASVVQRLLAAIREISGVLPGASAHVHVSSSVGFETYDGADLDSVETLRAHAEQALYAAKRKGGDSGVYFRAR